MDFSQNISRTRGVYHETSLVNELGPNKFSKPGGINQIFPQPDPQRITFLFCDALSLASQIPYSLLEAYKPQDDLHSLYQIESQKVLGSDRFDFQKPAEQVIV